MGLTNGFGKPEAAAAAQGTARSEDATGIQPFDRAIRGLE